MSAAEIERIKAEARRDALEEAAKVADSFRCCLKVREMCGRRERAETIAGAIRERKTHR